MSIKNIICITGKLNSFDTKAKAKEHLENLGYEVRSTVTKDVTILLNESGVESGKTKKARDNGVRIVTTIDELEVEHLPKGENKKSTKKDSSNLEPLTETETSLDKKKIALMKTIRSEDGGKTPEIIKGISKELKDNTDIALAAVQKNGLSLQHFSKKIRDNKEVVLDAGHSSFEFASKRLMGDKEFILLIINTEFSYGILERASKGLKADKEVVMTAVKKNGYSLQYASKSLKDDKSFFKAAIKLSGGYVLEYASKELKDDKQVVKTAVKNWGKALEYTSDNLRNDKEVVMAAVKSYGRALEYAFKELKADKQVVMAAVKQNGMALEYASKELKDDKQVVKTAVKNNVFALKYASKELKVLATLEDGFNSKFNALRAVKKNGRDLEYTSKELKADKEVVMVAVNEDGRALQFASAKLRDNKQVVMTAIKNTGIQSTPLQYASTKLRDDREVVMAALKTFGHGHLQYASKRLKGDKEFLMEASGYDKTALQYASKSLKDDKSFFKAAIKLSGGYVLEYASKKIKDDEKIVLAAVRQHYLKSTQARFSLEFISKRLKDNKKVVLASIKNNNHYYSSSLTFISKRLKNDDQVIRAAKRKRLEEYLTFKPFNPSTLKKFSIDREVFLQDLKGKNGRELSLLYVSAALRDDKEVVMAAVRQRSEEIMFASNRLKIDEEVIESGLINRQVRFQYTSKSEDEALEIIATTLNDCGLTYRYLCGITKDEFVWAFLYGPKSIKNHKKVVMVALKKNWKEYLQYVSKELRDDKEVVMVAVKEHSDALEYASKRLKDDKEVVMASLNEGSSGSFKYASKALQDDKEVVMAAIKNSDSSRIDDNLLMYASSKLKDDAEVVLAAVKRNVSSFKYASKRLKGDKEFFKTAIKKGRKDSIYAFESASSELQEDKDIRRLVGLENITSDKTMTLKEHIQALLKDYEHYQEIDPNVINELIFTEDLISYLGKKNKNNKLLLIEILEEVDTNISLWDSGLSYPEWAYNDKDIALLLIGSAQVLLSDFSAKMRADKEVVMAALETDPEEIESVSKALQKDKDIIALMNEYD